MKTDGLKQFSRAERFIASREFFGMKLGLDNILNYIDSLGSPQNKYPSIHIAGTNGKGSTVSMISSILSQAGYRVGSFTSPHLIHFTERIQVNGKRITPEYVSDFIESQRSEIKRRQITYFEVMVALAASYFARRKVDIAVFETGLGGRLDATNILLPIICGITEISYDHTSILGRTLKLIAREKGGIIKTNTPLALGLMHHDAENELRKIARQRSASVLELSAESTARRYQRELQLQGRHQIENLRLTLTIISNLRRKGYRIPVRAIQLGLSSLKWDGRFQQLKTSTGGKVIVDVAHNETGVKALVETFQRAFPGARAEVVVGLVKNKRSYRTLYPLTKIASSFTLTRLPSRRSLEPNELLAELTKSTGPKVIRKNPLSAVRFALRKAGPDGITLIVGSHYLIGEILRNKSDLFG